MAVPLSYATRSLRARPTTTVLTALGLSLVVFVFAASRMLSDGIAAALVATGSERNALVIRRSSMTEFQSVVARDSANVILTQPEVATGSDGRPLGAAEAVVIINLTKRGSGAPANVTVRGVSAASLAMREQVKLVEGEMWRPGFPEVVVARPISQRFEGAELGGTIRFGGRDWRVVGLFEAGGTGFDSEVWADGDQVLQALKRNEFSSLTLRLSSPEAVTTLKERLEADPRLKVEVSSELDYYRKQTQMMSAFLATMGDVVSALFSLGAIVGAMITMYAAVANRTTEIGTLRAIGFRRRHVLASFLFEAMALALTSGVLGVALASLLQAKTLSTTNWGTFSEIAFRFALTPQTFALSIGFALVMGLLGGVLPAARAARLDVVDALRAA